MSSGSQSHQGSYPQCLSFLKSGFSPSAHWVSFLRPIDGMRGPMGPVWQTTTSRCFYTDTEQKVDLTGQNSLEGETINILGSQNPKKLVNKCSSPTDNSDIQGDRSDMKGIIFTEFVDMVDKAFSPEVTDAVFDQCDLPSGGAYTSVGTYDHSEIVTLVTALSKETGIPVVSLVKTYGQHLFGRFAALYPEHFIEQTNSFDFLRHVENYIHLDVRKLYPDAELPRFEFEQVDDKYLVFYYLSSRHLGDVAEGLLRGCFAHFGETMDLQREDQSTPELAKIRFDLRLLASGRSDNTAAIKAA